MKTTNILIAAAALSLAGCSSFPGSGTRQADKHDAHHPAADCASKVDLAKVDPQKKAMPDMHRKMMAARTPAERAALMKDHMKAMQDGMATMEMMMQMMMMDRAPSSN